MENAKERLRKILKFFDDNKITIAIGFADSCRNWRACLFVQTERH